jgi:hypothetical protein
MSIHGFRAFINQPSVNQPLHKLHGLKGIAFRQGPPRMDTIVFYPITGDTISMEVQVGMLSQTKDFP